MTPPGSASPSMELPLVAPLRPAPPPTTSESVPATPIPLSKVAPLQPKPDSRILDFDVETVAAGFADPEWVPQKITCVAWSWIGTDTVESRICGVDGLFGKPAKRARMLRELLDQIRAADVVTGHNIARFDLPIINAECMRLGLEPVRSVRVEDTIRIVRAKGFKKGQDALGHLLRTDEEKLPLDWQQWQDGYSEAGWETIRRRCESDVIQHKQLRDEMRRRGWLKPTRTWRA